MPLLFFTAEPRRAENYDKLIIMMDREPIPSATPLEQEVALNPASFNRQDTPDNNG